MISDCKADELFKKAHDKLLSRSFFDCVNPNGVEERRSKAIEYFSQAGTLYKINNNWKQAGEAYEQASYISYLNNDKYDAGSYTEQAAKCFKNANINYHKYYNTAAKIYIEIGKFHSAAKCYEEINELEKAIKYYKLADYECQSYELLLKLIEKNIESGNYIYAATEYEKYAKYRLDNQLLRSSSYKYLFMALLCHIASINKSNIIESIEKIKELFEKYEELDPMFTEHTFEYKTINSIIESVIDNDINEYTNAYNEYCSICAVDKYKKILFLKCDKLFEDKEEVFSEPENEDIK